MLDGQDAANDRVVDLCAVDGVSLVVLVPQHGQRCSDEIIMVHGISLTSGATTARNPQTLCAD